jgi:phosphohistidine phosphatase SixA
LYSAGLVTRAALLAACIAALVPSSAGAQDAIYVVRHAERLDQSPDAPLSTDGVGRSYRLREMLRDAGVTHIFTTELRRTIDTARPLADALNLTPQQVLGADVAALAARVTALGAHDRALVVGHSNTVPQLLRVLGADQPVTLADSDYDNLFVIVPRKESAPTVVRLKF